MTLPDLLALIAVAGALISGFFAMEAVSSVMACRRTRREPSHRPGEAADPGRQDGHAPSKPEHEQSPRGES